MFTANESEVVGCGHELNLLLASFSFLVAECPCSRRRLTVPKLLSIIIITITFLFDFSLYNFTFGACYAVPTYKKEPKIIFDSFM